ncbi:MAG TPA: hypothetical protein VIA11_20465 [Acidimicrobiia bacterium]|jgi:hypothetical protein|nr:hypothetical protein [Acidimicrobiia bacterium]
MAAPADPGGSPAGRHPAGPGPLGPVVSRVGADTLDAHAGVPAGPVSLVDRGGRRPGSGADPVGRADRCGSIDPGRP